MLSKIFDKQSINLLLNSVSNGIVITDVDANIVWVNQGFTTLTGYSLEEVQGKNPRILQSKLHNKDFYKKMWSIITSRNVWNGEVVNRKKDGSFYYEEMTITPVIQNDKITHYIAIKQNITAKKKAEIELKKSEEFTRHVMQCIQFPILISTIDGNILDCNKAWEEMTGFSREEAINKNSVSDLRWISSGERKKLIEELQEKGSFKNKETQFTIKNGKKIDCLTSVTLGENYIIGSQVDITERKLEAEKYKALFENSYDSISIQEIDLVKKRTKLLDFNSSFIENSGYTKKELIECDNIINLVEFHKEKIIKDKEHSNIRYVYGTGFWKRKDHIENYFEYVATKIHLEDKIIVYCIHRDVTEKNKTKEIQERYQIIVGHAADSILLVDPSDTSIIEFNDAACNNLGYTREEFSKLKVYDFEHIEKERDVKKHIELMKKGKECYFESKHIKKNKEIMNVIVSNKFIISNNKEYILSIFHDITDITKTREKLENITRKLKTNNKILTDKNDELNYFSYIASHDLREPLRKIRIFSDMIQEKINKLDIKKEINKDIEIISKAVQKMEIILQDLLVFSRTSRKNIIKEETDINECVSSALEVIDIQGSKIIVTKLPQIKCDKTMTTQIFQNLINNAIKFNDKKEKVVKIYSLKSRSNNNIFVVEDNGIGIEKQYQNQIFIPFKKLNSAEEYPGTGMGLAICKKIIDKHGGKIWVESVLDKYSKFKFMLNSKED